MPTMIRPQKIPMVIPTMVDVDCPSEIWTTVGFVDWLGRKLDGLGGKLGVVVIKGGCVTLTMRNKHNY